MSSKVTTQYVLRLAVCAQLAWCARAVAAPSDADTPILTLKRVDTLSRIYPDLPPDTASAPAALHVPRGGKLPLQFYVRADTPGTCRLTCSPLRGSQGPGLYGAVALYHLQTVFVEANSQGCSKTYAYPKAPPVSWRPWLVREAPFHVAEVLVRATDLDIEANTTYGLLLDITIPLKASPGDYRGTLSCAFAGHTVTETFHFTVHATSISQYALHCTHWLSPHPENLTSQDPPAWWSPRHWALLQQAGQTLRAFGDSHILTPLLGHEIAQTDPAVNALVQTIVEKDGSYCFDFTRFEKWCRLFLSLGFEKIEGGHLGPGHDLIPLTVFALNRETGAHQKIFSPQADVPQWLDFLNVFYQALYAVLEKNNWTGHYVQHLMDEPHHEQEYRRMTAGFREHMPGIQNIDAIQSMAFSLHVDLQVFNLPTIAENQEYVQQRRQAGKAVWHYQCCSPYPPLPNRWLDHSLSNSRLFPLLATLLQSEGYLFWAANLYRGADPYNSSIGPLPSGSQDPGHPVGDAWLYYKGPEGLRGSMRMVAFREGLLDHSLLQKIAQKDKVTADRLLLRVARSLTDYESAPVAYHLLRRDLLEILDRTE